MKPYAERFLNALDLQIDLDQERELMRDELKGDHLPITSITGVYPMDVARYPTSKYCLIKNGSSAITFAEEVFDDLNGVELSKYDDGDWHFPIRYREYTINAIIERAEYVLVQRAKDILARFGEVTQ